MHELIQIWKKNASETNLKALNPIIASFCVRVRVNLLMAYGPFACGARLLFFTRHSRTRRPIRRIITTHLFSALLQQWLIGVVGEPPPAPPQPPPSSSVPTPARAVCGSSLECNRRELFTESRWSADAVCQPSLFKRSAKVGEKRGEKKEKRF